MDLSDVQIEDLKQKAQLALVTGKDLIVPAATVLAIVDASSQRIAELEERVEELEDAANEAGDYELQIEDLQAEVEELEEDLKRMKKKAKEAQEEADFNADEVERLKTKLETHRVQP